MNMTLIALGVVAILVVGGGFYGFKAWRENRLWKIGAKTVENYARSDERQKIQAEQQVVLDNAQANVSKAQADAEALDFEAALQQASKPIKVQR